MSHKAEWGFGSCPVTQKPTQCQLLQAESVARMGFMQSTPSNSPAHIWLIYSDAHIPNKGYLFIPGDARFDCLFVHIFQLLLRQSFLSGELETFPWRQTTAYLQPGEAY